MTAPVVDLLAYSDAELTALLANLGEPAFRARQITRQLYVNLVDDIQQMSDLPLKVRHALASTTRIG